MANEVCEKTLRCPPDIGRLSGKVLVVDDDEHFRVLARAILEPAGFDVIESEDLDHCLRQLRCQAVDAVILDMVMPDRDGIEGLRELKKLYPGTKVLTVSGVNDSELFLNVSAYLGADASLNKTEVASLPAMLDLVLDL